MIIDREDPVLAFLGKVGCAALSIVALCFMLGLIGCATSAPKTPAQTVFALKGGFGVALKAAVDYEGLPRCGGVTPICSDPVVMARIRVLADPAALALSAAEDAARRGALDPQTLLATENAVYAFEGLAATLKVK